MSEELRQHSENNYRELYKEIVNSVSQVKFDASVCNSIIKDAKDLGDRLKEYLNYPELGISDQKAIEGLLSQYPELIKDVDTTINHIRLIQIDAKSSKDVDSNNHFIENTNEIKAELATLKVALESSRDKLEAKNRISIELLESLRQKMIERTKRLRKQNLDDIQRREEWIKNKEAELSKKEIVLKAKEKELNEFEVELIEGKLSLENLKKLDYNYLLLEDLFKDFRNAKSSKKKSKIQFQISEIQKSIEEQEYSKKKNRYALLASISLSVAGLTIINYGIYSSDQMTIKSGFYLLGLGLAGLGIDLLKFLKDWFK